VVHGVAQDQGVPFPCCPVQAAKCCWKVALWEGWMCLSGQASLAAASSTIALGAVTAALFGRLFMVVVQTARTVFFQMWTIK
jgi:hypothetical protein